MLSSEEQALAVADQFYSAALGDGSWYEALDGLARATGSRSGQMISINSNGALPFNLVTNIDPTCTADFEAVRGGDPEWSPRVKAGIQAPILKAVAENDFITPDEHRRHLHYQVFARPWDIPYICLTTLDRRDGVVIGLAVCRSEREGHINSAQRAVFTAIVPHARAAARMHVALQDEAASLATGLFESLSLPAFLCDCSGRVEKITPAAESLIVRGRNLQIRGGYLKAVNAADHGDLMQAVATAADGPGVAARVPRSIVVRSDHPGTPPLLLDVIRLPARSREFGVTSRVLVLAQGAANAESRRRALLQTVYRLTAAETEVALCIGQGHSAEAIAAARGVAVATVRVQIKGILTKFGLRRQVELVAHLAQF